MGCTSCEYVCSDPASIENGLSKYKQYYVSPSSNSNRYQTLIENYWLRIIDNQTGVEKTYVLPGYRFEIAAWSPD